MGGPADSVGEVVVSMIARICNRPSAEVTPATTLQSLGIDSLAMPAIVTRLEALFEREFNQDQLLDFLAAVRVEDVATLVRRSVTEVPAT
jgi:acyl carrier protein